jgi:peptidyl-prolyl cis-trans isomerase SurA
MMKKIQIFLLTALLSLSFTSLHSQEMMIDEVVAVIGKNPILFSDIETQYMQYRMQGNFRGGTAARCQILESLLYQKLLLHQAEVDSVEVSDSHVESSMDARLRYYIQQFGSQEKLEEFYQKSIIEIKEEMRDLVKDQMRVEQVQSSIIMNVQITPAEVKSFYNRIPYDSLPLINTGFEIRQIVKNPPVSAEELTKSRDKIKNLRERIINGESFSTLAILYSEDPGSASKGGELGMFNRGTMYPEFEAASFNLNEISAVSEIVKTEAGYHIIQLIENNGEYINVRHILIQPKVSPLELIDAKNRLDSIAGLIEDSIMTFNDAALKFSDDPGKINGGLMINPASNTTRFSADELDPNVFFVIDKIEVGDVSQPVKFITPEGKEAYRILFLKTRTDPHRANLTDDYSNIQEWATEEKNNKVMQEWVEQKIQKTYIKVNDKYKSCQFTNKWARD